MAQILSASTTQQSDAQRQFSELLEQHRRILFKVADTYCWHADDRADLIQEMVAQLWRAFGKYDPQRSFTTWMYRVALNVAISFVRSNAKRQRHFVAMDENVRELAEHRGDLRRNDRIDFLCRFVERLDALNRALLLLYLEEHSYREIAAILGISETNVASKINRLKKRVRRDSEREDQALEEGSAWNSMN